MEKRRPLRRQLAARSPWPTGGRSGARRTARGSQPVCPATCSAARRS